MGMAIVPSVNAAIIVTRPQPECGHWVARLRAGGMQAQALPLIELRALAPPWPSLGEGQALQAPQALMFVSAAAVRHFFSAPGAAHAAGLRLRAGQARAWVTGPGSAKTLLEMGIEQRLIDQPATDADELDSEALWSVVAPQVRPGFAALILRGRDAGSGALGRAWLADRLAQAGTELVQCVVYERARPLWSEEQLQMAARASAEGAQWLLSSSQALANLQALLPQQDWRAARALVTHSRIAQAAREAGFGSVAGLDHELRRMLASIESSDESGESAAVRTKPA